MVRDLGGGRRTKDSAINYDVGIDSFVKPGEKVQKSSTIARIHSTDQQQAEAAAGRIQAAFEISEQERVLKPLIAEVVPAKG